MGEETFQDLSENNKPLKVGLSIQFGRFIHLVPTVFLNLKW